jgi:hypothetical protein
LDLRSLTSIPNGFNPTVGGSLYLSSLTSIPNGFNPTVGGYLDLRSLTSIPNGFNPTVGGYLDLSSLTSIPNGFNPTVGGSLDLRSSRQRIGSNVKPVSVNKNFFWHKENRRYAKIDGLFCEIISEKPHFFNNKKHKVYHCKHVVLEKYFYVACFEKLYAHGDSVKKAINDLEFKIESEKIKNNPIYRDTVVTVNHYRALTGACQMGCDIWMKENNITEESMKAGELVKLLEKTNAYGYEKFKSLIKD